MSFKAEGRSDAFTNARHGLGLCFGANGLGAYFHFEILEKPASLKVYRFTMSSPFKLLVFSFLATAVFAEDAKPKAPDADSMKRGQAVYNRTCIACHQPTGMGIPPVFPPLAGSEWVSKDASIAVRNIVNGMMGPITVKGMTYNSMMPPVAGVTDKEIADVVNFVNHSWGNTGPTVTEDEVKAIKKKYSDRKTPWTAAEYEKEAKEAPAKK